MPRGLLVHCPLVSVNEIHTYPCRIHSFTSGGLAFQGIYARYRTVPSRHRKAPGAQQWTTQRLPVESHQRRLLPY